MIFSVCASIFFFGRMEVELFGICGENVDLLVASGVGENADLAANRESRSDNTKRGDSLFRHMSLCSHSCATAPMRCPVVVRSMFGGGRPEVGRWGRLGLLLSDTGVRGGAIARMFYRRFKQSEPGRL